MEVEVFALGHGVTESSGEGSEVAVFPGLDKPENLTHPYRHPKAAIFALIVAYAAVLLIGATGNILIITIVAKTPRMRTVTNYFITNLAVADLLVLIFCLPPTLISNVYVPWVLGWFMCKTVPYIQGVTVCASVYSLVAISTDRFVAIWFPLRCQVTKEKAGCIILLIWTWAAVLALPWLLYFDLSHADKKQPSLQFCVEIWPEGMSADVYFIIVNLILFYLFPLGIISLCYFFIWLRVWRRHLPDDSAASRVELMHQRAKVRVLKMLIVVVAAFTVSWFPLYTIVVRLKLGSTIYGPVEEAVLDMALPIAQWLGASNSCINPILYAFFNGKFRKAFFNLFRGHEWTRQPTPHSEKPNVIVFRREVTAKKLHSSDVDMTSL